MKLFAFSSLVLSLFSSMAQATTCELTCNAQTADAMGVVATQAAFHPANSDLSDVAKSCGTDLLQVGSDQVQFQASDHFGKITLRILLNDVEVSTQSRRHSGFYTLQAGKFFLNCTIFTINLL